ncbi:AEC family transporter [Edaphobacter sp. HDX4]|uniref:AEC family transporter n=1 Tax=Edaphobacter sp. HDX4 TaxID=2794064 RepID=UPI002FE5EBC8
MIDTIFTTLIPVAFVVLLGYLAGRKSLRIADRATLTKLILSWLLPPLLLTGILETPRADLLNYKVPLIFFVGLMVPYITVLLVCRYLLPYRLDEATLKASLLTFPDMVFMGLPILHQLFGPSSLYPIVIANLVPTLLIVPLTSVLLELDSPKNARAGTHVFMKSFAKAIREPRVWVPFIGAAVVLLNVHIPAVLINSLHLIGQPTTGLSLFVVGLIVAEEKVRLTAAVSVDSLIKNLVQPAAMVVTVLIFGVSGVLAREAILLAALPSAVITTMFAEEYGTLQSESSTTILATRVLAFATIPVVFLLTRKM